MLNCEMPQYIVTTHNSMLSFRQMMQKCIATLLVLRSRRRLVKWQGKGLIATWWAQGCTADQWWVWHWCPSASCYQCPPDPVCRTSPLCTSHHNAESTASATGLHSTTAQYQSTHQSNGINIKEINYCNKIIATFSIQNSHGLLLYI